jgi:hypothetical protein
MSFTETPSTPPLDVSKYLFEEKDVEKVQEDEEDDDDSLQNEFNPFDPVWGVLYRSTLNNSVEVETKCLEKIGTLAALTFASDKLNSIGMTI